MSYATRRIYIPKVVADHLAGAEIDLPSYSFMQCSPQIRARAIEDARFLLEINFDGYEGYPQPQTADACRMFLKKVQP